MELMQTLDLDAGFLFGIIMRYKATHGLSSHPLYKVWKHMISRCENTKDVAYVNYGNRGIIVCDEWRESPAPFVLWALKEGWSKSLELDRTNNDVGYSASNCRFVTPSENSRNRRSNRYLTAYGETKLMIEWAEDERCKVSNGTLIQRINTYKWDDQKAISQPSRNKRKTV